MAGYCILNGEELFLRAFIGDPEGKIQLRYEASAPRQNALQLGKNVALWLLKNGGEEILFRAVAVGK